MAFSFKAAGTDELVLSTAVLLQDSRFRLRAPIILFSWMPQRVRIAL